MSIIVVGEPDVVPVGAILIASAALISAPVIAIAPPASTAVVWIGAPEPKVTVPAAAVTDRDEPENADHHGTTVVAAAQDAVAAATATQTDSTKKQAEPVAAADHSEPVRADVEAADAAGRADAD